MIGLPSFPNYIDLKALNNLEIKTKLEYCTCLKSMTIATVSTKLVYVIVFQKFPYYQSQEAMK